ncbi:uncharacterized protein LOC133888662 isoform X2 [Phragmites australis]|uniref:uncharacterized protein LOC133888662 isoform X2 n=1 Tax=Phragmites australis TaxID=29695 RepID=UPI002D79E40A|nr:uncharacterized protein LOC133888662 isoform X2 [Phragmites australis]
MAASVEGEREGAGSGEGKRLLHSLDYPCTERLRLRRLFAYLRGRSYADIYEAANKRMRVVFHVRDLVKQVKAGQLREAYLYVQSFVPMGRSSDEAEILSLFLRDLMAFNYFASGDAKAAGILCDWFIRIYRHPMLAKYPCFATLVDHVLFLRSDLVRSYVDWQLVRNKAAEMAEEMVCKTPELKSRLHYPRDRNSLYNVVSIGSSFRRRRQVKNLGRKQSTYLAQLYLQMKKRLPSSGQAESHGYSGSARKEAETLIALYGMCS